MAAKKTTNEDSAFIKKLKKLDHEYRIIQAHIDMLQEQLKHKEAEINAVLAAGTNYKEV